MYELVKPPDNTQILPGKWVFDVKSDSEGAIQEYRTRWVVCGNFQDKKNSERSAPVANETSVKIFLTKVATENMELRQIDIVSAYLHAALKDRLIYMKQPTGFEEGDTGDVWQLNQALYGLRESAFLWYKTFDEKIQKMGFRPLQEDPCVYQRKSDGCMLIIYVDDALIAAKSQYLIDQIIEDLRGTFGVKDLGEPKKFLGCTITRDRAKKTITLSQQSYVMETLAKFGMDFCRGYDIPMNPGWRAQTNLPGDADLDRTENFQSITGSLNWLAIKTRPDIQLATSKLQRQTCAPSVADLQTSKALLRYLKSHSNYGITLSKDPARGIELYTDAAHQDNPDGKSTEAHILMFHGAPIAWSSKKQSIMAPSSTIAEFCAYDTAIKQGIWIRKLLAAFELHDGVSPIPLYTDSANGIIIAKSKTINNSVRWLDNRFFFIRDIYTNGDMNLEKIDGHANPADGLTKALHKDKFEAFQRLIGMEILHEDKEQVKDTEKEKTCDGGLKL